MRISYSPIKNGQLMIKKWTQYFLFLLLSFCLMEFCFFIAVKSKAINILMPTYELNSPNDFLSERSFIYGHRHQANGTFEVRKNCLHNYYQFNSLGFRDEEPIKKANGKRVIVLGDSFMEGIGVSESERLSDLLEEQSEVPHLNFGMGDKGPTQLYSIYKNIASEFEHDAIIISLFPANDFIDDDPSIGKTKNSIRPCWIGDYPNYQLQFVPDSAPAKKEDSKWKLFLKRYTYTYDALFYLKESIKAKFANRSYPKLGYFDYSQEHLNRMIYSLEQIKKLASDKKIILLAIPSHLELQGIQNNSQSIEIPLKEFCNKMNIEFYGLYTLFKKASSRAWEDYYLSCDSHWNQEGHAWLANHLLAKSDYYRLGN